MEPFEIRVNKDIALRLHQEKTAPTLFSLIEENRTHFREWLPWLDFNTKIEDTSKFISECENSYKNGISLNLGIYYLDTLVGSVGFNTINLTNKSAEIGYMLGKEFIGLGIMTKSCKAIVDYGFNELKLNRITIKCATKNTKSRAIAEKLGFKLEGIIDQNEWLYDHFVDHAHYGMLKENWK